MLLSILSLLPIIGCVCVLLIYNPKWVKLLSLYISIIIFFLSLVIWAYLDKSFILFMYQCTDIFKLPLVDFYSGVFFGIDGLSIIFIVLTSFIVPICLLRSWYLPKNNIKFFIICFFLIEFFLILSFSVKDLVLFYIFFESILIPMFLVIGIWGSRERKIKAAYYFFMYTFVGSIFMLIAIMVIHVDLGSTNLITLCYLTLSKKKQIFLFFCFFLAFSSKIPMIPFHIWLPEAHVEAPTEGSVMLASLLLKLGGYGFLRFCLPLFPYACIYFKPFIFCLSCVSIVYASLTAIRQIDLKRIIAYSSVAHMNLVVLGIFSLNYIGIQGSIFLMVAHGIVSGALFLLVGVLYDRYHTRLIRYFSGLVITMPLFSVFFLVFLLANIGLPGTLSFVGEILILCGVFLENTATAVVAATSCVLSTIYSLLLYNRVCFGNVNIQYILKYKDLGTLDIIIFSTFFFLVVLFGINPGIILDTTHSYSLFLYYYFIK